MVLGGAGVVASGAAAPACVSVVGCAAVAGGAILSADQAVTGSRQMVSGRPETTGVSHTLQSLGLSPETAGLVEMVAGVGTAVGTSRVLMNATSPARVGGISTNAGSAVDNFSPIDSARTDLASSLHVVELGKDPAKGLFVLDEAITGARLESIPWPWRSPAFAEKRSCGKR